MTEVEPLTDKDAQVIEILPNGKYVILLEGYVPYAELERLRNRIVAWQSSGFQFLLLTGKGITLERVDG